MTILEWARYYRDKGFSVIPIKFKDKEPAIPSWKEYQDRLPTEKELELWFNNGSQHNIAIITGKVSGIVAVDLDSEKAIKFAKEHNFPASPLSKTGKGYHIIYRYRDGVRNFQKRDDLPDIDLRGDGGYFVVEPSVHPLGHQYRWVRDKSLDDLPFAELPEMIFCRNPQDKTPLKELYNGVDKGQRNDTLARLTGSWVNDGLAFEECLEMAHSWNSKNNPPLPEREVERTVRSIFSTHHRGQTTTLNISTQDLLSALLKWNDILSLDVKTEYLLEKLIPKNSIALLFGRGGIGKTSISMQIARAIANGLPFDTMQTIQTPVYYIDFENPLAVLKERVEKIGQSENLYVWHLSNVIQPPKLDSSGWELYKQLPAGLLIIDTLRASHLSDENDSRPMSLIMGRLKELREMGFTILLLHHTPKGNENTFKGSTALLDLCDHVLGLEEIKGHEGENIEFDCENLYKLGTRIKTRYEPHSIYLTFKPDIKGFEIAKDPDIEKMENIRDILNQPLKQKELREQVKKEMDLPDREIRRLLKKGTGLYWNTEKSDRNATIYTPINSVCQFVKHIYSGQTEKLESSQPEILTNRPSPNTPQSLKNTEFGSFSEGIGQTEKLKPEPVFIDAEVEL